MGTKKALIIFFIGLILLIAAFYGMYKLDEFASVREMAVQFFIDGILLYYTMWAVCKTNEYEPQEPAKYRSLKYYLLFVTGVVVISFALAALIDCIFAGTFSSIFKATLIGFAVDAWYIKRKKEKENE